MGPEKMKRTLLNQLMVNSFSIKGNSLCSRVVLHAEVPVFIKAALLPREDVIFILYPWALGGRIQFEGFRTRRERLALLLGDDDALNVSVMCGRGN